MAAVGDVSEDLAWMRGRVGDLLASDRMHSWPWEPPANAADLKEFSDSYPGLPSDVCELFSVSRKLVIGDTALWGDFVLDGAERIKSSRYFMMEMGILQDCSYRYRSQRPDPFVLDGLPVTIGLGLEGCYLFVELYGEDHGRVVVVRLNTHDEFQVSERTLAWSVTDLVACTRDLYESGWRFESSLDGDEWMRVGPAYAEDRDAWQDDERERIGSVIPILDRWNCGDPTIPFERWQVEPREPVPPVVSRLNGFVGLSVRSVKEAIRELSGRNPVEVARLLEGFWESDSGVLGPGEQVSVLDMMDALGVPTLKFLDADLESLAGGVVVSGSEPWTRFVYGRALMRRREVRRDPGDVDVLLALTSGLLDHSYWIWPYRMLDWLSHAAVEDDTGVGEVLRLLEPLSRSENRRIGGRAQRLMGDLGNQ